MSTSAGELLDGSAAARRAASQILAEPRFHQPEVPRPLHGVLATIGRAVQVPLTGLQSLVDKLATILPGGVAGAWILLAALALIAAIVTSRRVAHRGLAATASPRAPGPTSAAELERLAAAAQDAGQLDEAVRLRFRAGLTRLGQRETFAGAPTRPTLQIARALDSPEFDSLAHRFDEIAYGSSPATADDVDQQRREWPQILRAGGPPRPAGGES
ncbi:MAG TPA: hypothetical protein VGG07_18210 [Solirubrobacteraceae bacterium]|jgi:hypothetical protein